MDTKPGMSTAGPGLRALPSLRGTVMWTVACTAALGVPRAALLITLPHDGICFQSENAGASCIVSPCLVGLEENDEFLHVVLW